MQERENTVLPYAYSQSDPYLDMDIIGMNFISEDSIDGLTQANYLETEQSPKMKFIS